MRDSHYYAATLTIFYLEAAIAISVADVASIFDFIAGFTCSFIGFGFAGLFYVAAERHSSPLTEIKDRNWNKAMAYLHILLCIVVFILCITSKMHGQH
jgi:hypothetical protein